MYQHIFDTHAHYTDDAFAEDRDAVLSALPGQGVQYILLAACDEADTGQCIALAERYPYIYSAAGVHPERVDTLSPDWLARIENFARHEKVRAIGEIGLDYHYESYDAELQKTVFRSHLELAKRLELPVIVHIRDAMGDAMEILREYKPQGVVHCYSGSAETAKEILRLGMHISFTGVLTFKNARRALEALAVIPADRLMLETDCPYMAPVPMRGKRCDSSMIAYTAEKAAELRGIPTQQLIDECCETGKKLFRIQAAGNAR